MSMSCNIQFRAGKLIKEKKSAIDAETEVIIKEDVTADSNKERQMEKKKQTTTAKSNIGRNCPGKKKTTT